MLRLLGGTGMSKVPICPDSDNDQLNLLMGKVDDPLMWQAKIFSHDIWALGWHRLMYEHEMPCYHASGYMSVYKVG